MTDIFVHAYSADDLPLHLECHVEPVAGFMLSDTDGAKCLRSFGLRMRYV